MERTDAYLEIGLRWRRGESGRGEFDVNLDFDDPADSGDRRDYGDVPVTVDPPALAQLVADEAAYGVELCQNLFGSKKVADFYRRAREVGQRGGIPVHFRLLVDPEAPPSFQAVRWESLRDPDWETLGDPDLARIAVRRNMLFSRLLNSDRWDVVSPPPKHDLKALVVVAGPSDVADFGNEPLAEVDVEGGSSARGARSDTWRPSSCRGTASERRSPIAGRTRGRHRRALPRLPWGDCQRALAALPRGQRRQGRAGGRRGADRRPRRADAAADAGVPVLVRLRRSGDPDLLADGSALTALGPRFAQAGVPAVVAMQGEITMATAAAFIPRFFEELEVDGPSTGRWRLPATR